MARRSDYGRILPTRQWNGKPSRRWWQAWKPWALLALLIAAWYGIDRAWVVEPPRPQGTPQAIAQPFHRCGQGRGANCVVDGDTLVMGQRRIRIIGIDAPEIGQHARCPREAQMAEAAAAELLRLVNQGPFTLQPPTDGLRDEYGRELMHITRAKPGAPVQDIAADLIASGHVRAYDRGARQGWCS